MDFSRHPFTLLFPFFFSRVCFSCSTFLPWLSLPIIISPLPTFCLSLLILWYLPATRSSSMSFPVNCPCSSLSRLLHLLSSLLSPCSVRDKFVEVDLKPVCKHCYERLPDDMKRRLAKRERDSKEKKKKPLIPMCLWTSLSPFSSFPLFFLWSVSTFLPSSFYFSAFSLWLCFKHAACYFYSSCHCWL